MIHTTTEQGERAANARDPDVTIDRAVEIGGVSYVMPTIAVEMLARGTGLRATQAADRLRRFARDGSVRTIKLAAKLRVYAEVDLIKARRELLDGTR
jgi:hypothetical protein